MQLSSVLETAPVGSPVSQDWLSIEVSGIAYDSRKIAPGFLFFAFHGSKLDGTQFAGSAIEKGAVAVVSERPQPPGFRGRWIQVAHGRQALAVASRNFYGKPDERVALTAVTGTNGKTTSTTLIDAILRAAGKKTALIGTIEYHLGGKRLPAVNTTPESLDLFRMFHELEMLGGTHATIEASSHALDLGRIYGMHFHTAAFTNLTRDHLDHHKSMDAYFAAKHLLFEPKSVAAPAFAVINTDDEWARRLRIPVESEVFWYGIDQKIPANRGMLVQAKRIESSFEGLRFEIEAGEQKFNVESPLIGRINVYNILLACSAALAHGVTPEQIQKGLKELSSVPGRFERIEEGQPFLVVVDYAHTDDALRNVIAAARGLNPKRVITVFGCGGDRDRTKRPLMGMAAAEASDFVVLTSDNPRSEDPLAIMNDAMVGLRRFDTPHVAEPDRERAIRKAIQEAQPGDIVILAGKGHETYQILKDGPIQFDDREIARRVLRSSGYSRQSGSRG
jgi:UDP-N-acetylmuramoyl-L-alanyl-D-glutamate--2,6-diaminopimelate ligase